MDVPVGNQAAQGPGQQQPAAEAELPGVEGQQEGQAASDEEGWMYGEEEEDQGPQPLLQLAQRQVLAGIEAAARGMKPAFSVGGSLGRMSVVLAVTSMPSGGAEGPAAAPSQPAVAVRFPEGGQAALQALEAVCQPATFGKGSEEGGVDSSALQLYSPGPASALPCHAMPCTPCHAMPCLGLRSYPAAVPCHAQPSCC